MKGKNGRARIPVHPTVHLSEGDAAICKGTAAQARGEVHRHGGKLPRDVAGANITSATLGLRRDEIYQARGEVAERGRPKKNVVGNNILSPAAAADLELLPNVAAHNLSPPAAPKPPDPPP